jgi:3-dehydroquinate synthase
VSAMPQSKLPAAAARAFTDEAGVAAVHVALGNRSYVIHIGERAMEWASWGDWLSGRQVAIVFSPPIALHALTPLKAVIAPHVRDLIEISIPDGEKSKSYASLDLIYDALLARPFDRKCVLIALGGGVIGDLTGFAAATYQRGVDFVQVPTTLLAMVDSSVGGKTAINHTRGKNMVGAFHQPIGVVADIALLNTLPEREYISGLAEVIKYGLIYDAQFLVWLEGNIEAVLARDPAALGYAVRRSCEIKAEIVAQDERETGIRAWLNLGHTFGHAIEVGLGYGQWLHGEAVAAGTVLALQLSHSLGYLVEAEVNRAIDLLKRAKLPVAPPALGAARYLSLMRNDKKADAGKIRYVVLRKLGQAHVQAVEDTLVAPLLEVL